MCVIGFAFDTYLFRVKMLESQTLLFEVDQMLLIVGMMLCYAAGLACAHASTRSWNWGYLARAHCERRLLLDL